MLLRCPAEFMLTEPPPWALVPMYAFLCVADMLSDDECLPNTFQPTTATMSSTITTTTAATAGLTC